VVNEPLVVAFLDQRQFHPGHVLVVPREHVNDIRTADPAVAHAVIDAVARITRAVDRVFPSDGISVWHSIGPGANQEVPHLHFHVHPRKLDDQMFRAYPSTPAHPNRDVLDDWAAQLKATL
jgi:histidine triad (HIT) family protein